ncbi:hypothetical protein FRB90_005121, partial [Tulasnella sp. 427]
MRVILRFLWALFAFALVFVAAAPSPTIDAERLKRGSSPIKPKGLFNPTPRSPSTNAERFKRGLSPLKPKSLYNPTRRQGGSNPLSSSAPPIKAVIRAYDMSDPSNPSFYGYVTPAGYGVFTVTQDASQATVIQAQLASLQPGNLDFVSPPYNGYPELGFAGPSSDIGSGSAVTIFMSGTQSTTKKSPSTSTPNQSYASGRNEFVESAV